MNFTVVLVSLPDKGNDFRWFIHKSKECDLKLTDYFILLPLCFTRYSNDSLKINYLGGYNPWYI